MDNNSGKKTILLVEDEEAMLQALFETFEERGYKVERAKTGKEGLEVATRDHPNLIIMDILMPEMDGMTMIKNLRVDEWGKRVPVIILSNVNPETNHILQSIMESQPSYYLIKANVSLSEIADKADSILHPNNS